MWDVTYKIRLKSRLLHSEDTVKDLLEMGLGGDIIVEDCECIIHSEWAA